MLPLAIVLIFALNARNEPAREAAQTATAGLITLIPEGLVLLMSVTLAVAAVRLARLDTLVQQMSATEALAAVDTICVDKTGTLTTGELKLVSVEVADQSNAGRRAPGARPLRRQLGRAQPNPRGDRARTTRRPGSGSPPRCPSHPSGSGAGSPSSGRGGGETYVLGAPDVLAARGALELPADLQRALDEHTRGGRRVVAFGRASGRLPADPDSEAPPPIAPLALVVLEETLRPDAEETIAFMREQEMDLKLISGDARQTVTAVATAVGVPEDAGVVDGDELPEDHVSLGRAAAQNTIFCRIRPEQKKALVSALAERGRFTAMIGDGVNDVPALKRARLAVAMGSGSQITKGIADIVLLKDQFSRLPRAVAEGRRIARNIHRLGRLYVTKTVYAAALIAAVAIPGLAFPFLPRHLTLAAFLTIGIPSLRPRARPQRRPALPRHGCCGRWRRSPSRRGSRSPPPRSPPSSSSTPSSAARSRRAGPRRPPPWSCSASASSSCSSAAPAASTSRSRATCSPWSRRSGRSTRWRSRSRSCATSSSSPSFPAGSSSWRCSRRPGGLVLASIVWRLPAIERLEERPPAPEKEPHGPVTAPSDRVRRRDERATAPPNQDRRHRRPGEPRTEGAA